MTNLEDHVRAALRKRGRFVYNRYDSKSSRYRDVLAKLKEAGEIVVKYIQKDYWEYTKGPNWTRRPEKQK